MAYNESLAGKVRKFMEGKPGFAMKKMFGGVCYLLNGNMACGVLGDNLIVRVDQDRYAECLEIAGTRKFDITGREMKGWVMVSCEDGLDNERFSAWVERGAHFALGLPPK
jgi:TfoX/Sxy family transcriptional regulator of competence genes